MLNESAQLLCQKNPQSKQPPPQKTLKTYGTSFFILFKVSQVSAQFSSWLRSLVVRKKEVGDFVQLPKGESGYGI